jgi:hypothetical protein
MSNEVLYDLPTCTYCPQDHTPLPRYRNYGLPVIDRTLENSATVGSAADVGTMVSGPCDEVGVFCVAALCCCVP